jgi:Holliday junction resolvase RusA-like endonuclease
MIYIIEGDPVPLARVRAAYHSRHMYDSQKDLKIHRLIELQNMHQDAPPLAGPLHLDITFYLKMPKLSPRKRKEKNHSYHQYRPDLSNLIKFVEDIAQHLIFDNDSQIAQITSRKVYHEKPRTEFQVTQIDPKKKYHKE